MKGKIMARNTENNYHPNFVDYMEKIISNPNYQGLPIRHKADGTPVWVATKKSKTDNTGINREKWADNKAIELGPAFVKSSKKYADTMFAIHPTKKKVCQVCGETMDLHYVYPTKNTVKYFQKNFGYSFNKYDSIYDILLQLNQYEKEIATYLIKKAALDDSFKNKSIDEIIVATELACRMGGKSIFSPGAMSNFPDRFDGFHSYNLCCRKDKDKGRHDNNMATYTKDRRAYEYWSDGNIAAANQLMHDPVIFNGMSADHIGPISLGFKHDPLFLQPMISNDNSAKRDRLYDEDMKKLISIEIKTGVSPASTFSNKIWEFIKTDYLSDNRLFALDWYRDILKQNMVNFMESIWILLDTDNKIHVEKFFDKNYFEPKYTKYFNYRYTFNSDGSIKDKETRNITASSKDEFSRFRRISFDTVDDFHLKSESNRNNTHDLSATEINQLNTLRKKIIESSFSNDDLLKEWESYLELMQEELISNWTE
ncbi:TPA: Alw26I/Eco31I/Esp3I family type II restriction endonuclease [Listeria monocytogenes]|nr:Alw26I/Eco31I/Esp3I family type II restriction endonuclease [Listeria monocytogenes]